MEVTTTIQISTVVTIRNIAMVTYWLRHDTDDCIIVAPWLLLVSVHIEADADGAVA